MRKSLVGQPVAKPFSGDLIGWTLRSDWFALCCSLRFSLVLRFGQAEQTQLLHLDL
jgi:hypothetical protein